MAKWISSALVCRPSVSIIWYLWNSTVRAEIERLAAISFAERPSARSWRTSRCRGVREATGSLVLLRPLLHGLQDLARELRREVGLALERGADGRRSARPTPSA